LTPQSSAGESEPLDSSLARLDERGRLREHAFTSPVPLVGGLIAAFRSLWNGVATRWYVRPLIDQQSEVNALTLEALRQLAALYQELDARVAEQDRDGTDLARRVAELTTVLVRLERQVAASNEPGGPPGR
jgi:hypothetical protein